MNDLFSLNGISPVLYFVIILWSLLWRGLGLWTAARHEQKNWFLVMLVINTVGILEIVYLFGFAKKKMKLNDLMFWNKKAKESPKSNKSK